MYRTAWMSPDKRWPDLAGRGVARAIGALAPGIGPCAWGDQRCPWRLTELALVRVDGQGGWSSWTAGSLSCPQTRSSPATEPSRCAAA